MDGQAVMTVSAAVVTLVQILKWAGINDKLGPIAVVAVSAFGVVFWGYSVGTYERTQAFAYFAGWIAVATSAAGVFGFTRAATSAVTSAKAPPAGGAGANITEKL